MSVPSIEKLTALEPWTIVGVRAGDLLDCLASAAEAAATLSTARDVLADYREFGTVAELREQAERLAPQPEPCEHPATFDGSLRCPTCMQAIRAKSPQVDAVMRSIEEYRNAPSGTASVPRQPEPPASDEPARCGHGETEAHPLRCDKMCDAAAGGSCFTPWCRCQCHHGPCPGPAASGTPDGER